MADALTTEAAADDEDGVNSPNTQKRLDFAEENDGFDFTNWAVVDEKIFSEDKHRNEEVEARVCSPLTDREMFHVMAAETQTQLKKKMFLVAMTEGKKKPAKGKKPRKSMNVVNGKYATNG